MAVGLKNDINQVFEFGSDFDFGDKDHSGGIMRLLGMLDSPYVRRTGITAAVTWFFLQAMLPELIMAADHPALRALSGAAETTESFRKYAHAGPGVLLT